MVGGVNLVRLTSAAKGVLLVAKVGAVLPSVKVQVVQKPAGALLDEETDVLAVRALGEAEDTVGDGGGLRRRPVDRKSRRGRRDVGGVEDEVADLSEEDVGSTPCQAVCAVLCGTRWSDSGSRGSLDEAVSI